MTWHIDACMHRRWPSFLFLLIQDCNVFFHVVRKINRVTASSKARTARRVWSIDCFTALFVCLSFVEMLMLLTVVFLFPHFRYTWIHRSVQCSSCYSPSLWLPCGHLSSLPPFPPSPSLLRQKSNHKQTNPKSISHRRVKTRKKMTWAALVSEIGEKGDKMKCTFNYKQRDQRLPCYPTWQAKGWISDWGGGRRRVWVVGYSCARGSKRGYFLRVLFLRKKEDGVFFC